MNYIDAVFWQIETRVPKEDAHAVEDFFMKSGALSMYELLYAEGETHNLVEENTSLFFFFEKKFPARAFAPMALAILGQPDAPLRVVEVCYQDYLKEFEKSFKAFMLTEKTALVPPWDKQNPEISVTAKRLFLVPGMAFGTGKHATTQMMIEFLERMVRSTDTVIDMGCGSGILALAALLWGARGAVGFDVETLAVESAAANLELNAQNGTLAMKARFYVGDFASLEGTSYLPSETLFVANILPNVFEANAVALKKALASCRSWALSGIPHAQEAAFSDFLRKLGVGEFDIRNKEDWLLYAKREK